MSQLAIDELMSSMIEPVHTVENVLMKNSCSASTSRQTNLINTLTTPLVETANWPACWPRHGDLGNGDCFQKDNLRTWCLCFCFGPSQKNNVCFKLKVVLFQLPCLFPGVL